MAYTLLEEKIRDGECVLYHNYLHHGHALDLSGNGNHGTIVAAHEGWGGLEFERDNGRAEVANAAELDTTTLSLIAFGAFFNMERSDESHIYAKRDGAGIDFDWRLDNTPQMEFDDGTNVRTLALDYTGAWSLGLTLTAGGAADGFKNGLIVGAFSGASTPATAGKAAYIGNRESFDHSLYNPLWALLHFNVKLTEAEMARIHGEYMEEVR